MFVQGAEQVRFVAAVLLVGAVEFQVLQRHIHKHCAVEKHVAQTVRTFAQPVGRRFHDGILTAVLEHFVQLALYNRRFRCGLVLRVGNGVTPERILNRRDEARFAA